MAIRSRRRGGLRQRRHRTLGAGRSRSGVRADAFAAARLSRAQRDFLAAFVPGATVEITGLGPVRFVHGSPRSDTEPLTTLTPPARLSEVLAGVDERVVVCGHTHRQFDRAAAGRRIVNAGSVGIPYEGRVGAYWALLGPAVELRGTEYDLEVALAALRTCGFPDGEEMLRESQLEPVDPDEVSRLFESWA